MPEWIGDALGAAQPYWPFLTKLVVIWYLGQFFKKQVWTKKRAARGRIMGFMRDTLPVHPLIAGALWGALYPYAPAVTFVTSRGGAVNEGILAGVLTLILHTGLDALAEARGWTWLQRILRETVPDRETSSPPPPGP